MKIKLNEQDYVLISLGLTSYNICSKVSKYGKAQLFQ